MAATPHPDELTPVTFDKPRHLWFNLRAIRALDRQMGEVGVAKALELLRALNFQTLERVLWAGLIHEEPTLTVSLVSKRLDTFTEAGGDTKELFLAAYSALNGSGVFGGKDETEGNAQPEPAQA